MTNREKFKNELDELLGEAIGVDADMGTPMRCKDLPCPNCLFNGSCFNHTHKKSFVEWLNEEYTEPIKTVKASDLSVDTKVLCWDHGDNAKYKEHFAGLKDGILYAFSGGKSSWTAEHKIHWKHMTLEDGTIILAK